MYNKHDTSQIGNILRSNDKDPVVQVIIEPYTVNRPREIDKRRKGKPRDKWYQKALVDAWNLFKEKEEENQPVEDYDHDHINHRFFLAAGAKDRLVPFDTKLKHAVNRSMFNHTQT